ncbi:MAG TPA: hypothetical protein VEV41_28580 [Terriglobales bacterium]|nr:hypothetical protein [Terriglobales bacterium]
MGISPSSTYRIAGRIVIFVMLTAGVVLGQFAKRGTISKGPRALGLLQLATNGKGHLVPICIMVDGRFYDASIYKADPVPMALESGTVYEAERTGESLGLFTVTGALQGNKMWLGDGKWQPAGAAPEQSTAQKAESKPREEEDRPPVLRRPGSEPPKPESKPPETKPAPPAASAPPANPPAATPSAPPPEEDSKRPRLRRGKPTESEEAESEKGSMPKAPPKTPPAVPSSSASPSTARNAIEIIPAISDAGGPEARSYRFQMRPDEEQVFRKKVLALAVDEVWKRAKELEPGIAAPPPPRATPRSPKGTTVTRPPQATFGDMQLRVFDVSASNEPVLVLTATAHLPATRQKAHSLPAPDYYVTVVAHSDLYGELHKLFSAVTDTQHLDVTPRMELIDAVDADGDGRGELLFREISDAGSSYVVYRVGADQLWQLFEGTPSRVETSVNSD